MPRFGLINMVIGFWLIFLGACGGAFLGLQMESLFSLAPQEIWSKKQVMLTSAHSHANLFGVVHILFGLTLPYLRMPQKIVFWETLGLFCGSLSVIFLLPIRAVWGDTDLLFVLNSVMLSLWLFALFFHGCFLTTRIFRGLL